MRKSRIKIFFAYLFFILDCVACGKDISPSKSLNAHKEILGQFADILNSLNPPFESPFDQDDPLKNPALTAVTREFGLTTINTKLLPLRVEKKVIEPKPWSSWWYPKIEDGLFRDKNSALRKYDSYRKWATGQNSAAADVESKNFNSSSAPWEGMCDAWALAAISHPEPIRPIKIQNLSFSIYDLKGLLLKTYEQMPKDALKMYGQVFTGDENSWIHPDLFPDQFHRFIEVQIFDHSQPFIMDHDPGVEIWNEPVFGANYLIEANPLDQNSVNVKLWTYSAAQRNSDEREALGTKTLTRQYNYTLTGTRDSSGILRVTGGYWTDRDGVNSRKDHPDFVMIFNPNFTSQRSSLNTEIDTDLVEQLLKDSY